MPEDILETGEAAGSRIEALVHALPVAIRATILCEELGCEHERLNEDALGRLGERLRQHVEEHPTHSPGWALLAIWWRLQSWLGHKSINETKIYVHVAESHAREWPEPVRVASEVDPVKRILAMLGARGKRRDARRRSGCSYRGLVSEGRRTRTL